MKGLLVYFAIVCLALASGAPTEEEGKVLVVSKSFNFDKKDVIYARNPFFKDELVFAVCEGNSDDKKCKVYAESPNRDTVQSCDLNLTYQDGLFDFNIVFFNAGNSKAVFALREFTESARAIKLISINLKDCQIGETGVDLPLKLTHEATPPLNVVIVAHEKNYDVVYRNTALCHEFLCKATFDYEGKVVKAPSGFLVPDFQSPNYRIESVKNAYLVIETNSAATYVRLVREDDTKPHTLLIGPPAVAGLSAEENKLGFCTYVGQKLLCQQYDAEGKTKINEVELIAIRSVAIRFLDILNVEKGLLTVSVQNDVDNGDKEIIFVTHFDERGSIGKFVEVDLKCDRQKVVFPKLYKSSNGDYCVSAICAAPLDRSGNHATFSRKTRCFHKAELF